MNCTQKWCSTFSVVNVPPHAMRPIQSRLPNVFWWVLLFQRNVTGNTNRFIIEILQNPTQILNQCEENKCKSFICSVLFAYGVDLSLCLHQSQSAFICGLTTISYLIRLQRFFFAIQNVNVRIQSQVRKHSLFC